MAQPYAELPNTIFGLTSSQQRVLRIKELLSYYKVPFSKSATKVQLLRHLATLEDQFSDREQRYLSAWLRGGGLLSDLKATLRKAQALTKNITVVMESSLLARELIVPLSGEQECSVCLTTFTGDAFPRKRISTSCKHGSFTCLACLKQSLEIQVQENPWDHITCPECPAMIAYQGVKEFASPQAFERYLHLQSLHLNNVDVTPGMSKRLPLHPSKQCQISPCALDQTAAPAKSTLQALDSPS